MRGAAGADGLQVRDTAKPSCPVLAGGDPVSVSDVAGTGRAPQGVADSDERKNFDRDPKQERTLPRLRRVNRGFSGPAELLRGQIVCPVLRSFWLAMMCCGLIEHALETLV